MARERRTETLSNPRVDILMAAYNGEKYIAEQIASIIGQTYSNWRLLISDDGSSDSTVEVVSSLAKKDPRIQIVSSRNRSGTAAGNFFGMLHYVGSEYAMFCDQDDVWDVDKVEVSLENMLLLENEHGKDGPLLVFTDSRVVDEDLKVINPSFVSFLGKREPRNVTFAQLVYANIAQGCTMMFNRHLADLVDECRPDGTVLMHDWLTVLLAKSRGHVAYIDKATMSYRQHGNNEVGAGSKESFSEWSSRIFFHPSALKGVFLRAKSDGSKPIARAEALLHLREFLSGGDVAALEDIAGLPGSGLINKARVFGRYKLLNKDGIHFAAYQCLSLILI